MRFCRSFPRPATGKSNCDSSRYRCASVPPRPYHRNRTFLHGSVRGLSGKRYRPALVHFFFFPPSSFSACRFHSPYTHRLPPLLLFSTVCLLFLSYYFFPSPVFCRPPCLSLATNAFCQPTSYIYYPLSLSTYRVQTDVFPNHLSLFPFLSSCPPLFNSFFTIKQFAASNYVPRKKGGMTD